MMDRREVKNLKKRYLIWFYKSAKESLDKIEPSSRRLRLTGLSLRS